MKRIRDAATIVGSLEGGEAAADLSKEITDTLAYLKELCGGRPKVKAKGSVTFKVNFEVQDGATTVEVEITSKRPKKPRSSSYFWVLDDGSLSTEHPSQIEMFSGPRSVERVAAE